MESEQNASVTQRRVAFRFVSIPDLFNADMGNVRGLPGWDPGDSNSMNRYYKRAIDIVFDKIAAEDPEFVAVAGDQVEGHWGIDVDQTGIFGPVNTTQQQLRALERAGHLYYGQWRRRFKNRGLRVFPALGDHEIGDDYAGRAMNDRWPPDTFRHRAVPNFKKVWAHHMTRFNGKRTRFPDRPRGSQWARTAYAVKPNRETLWVTVDVFRHHAEGVQLTVRGAQYKWLKRVLSRAKQNDVDHVIVQGHVPVLGPVRASGSGELKIPRGRRSKFWQLLKDKNVDMYLCGEVHAVTAIDRGVVQICHGGLIAYGSLNYMLGTVYTDGTVNLKVKRFQKTAADHAHRLWQTSEKRPPLKVTYDRRTKLVATGSYGPETGFTGTGLFKPYRPND